MIPKTVSMVPHAAGHVWKKGRVSVARLVHSNSLGAIRVDLFPFVRIFTLGRSYTPSEVWQAKLPSLRQHRFLVASAASMPAILRPKSISVGIVALATASQGAILHVEYNGSHKCSCKI